MIKRKTGICIRCQEEADNLGVPTKEKELFRSSPKLCLYHAREYTQKKKKPSKAYVKKATGELDMFKEIWEEREHVSFVSGDHLGEFNVCFFAHCIPKGSYPSFRLRKENIVLLTKDEHYLYDFQSHKIKEDDRWKPLLELKEKLKKEYNDSRRVERYT